MLFRGISAKIDDDFTELFEDGFQIFDDFPGDNIGIGESVGVFEALVSQPEDVEAGVVG